MLLCGLTLAGALLARSGGLRDQAQLGSHFKTKICATPREERRLRDAEALARAQSGGQCRGEGC